MAAVSPQFGWLGAEKAADEWQRIGGLFPAFAITGVQGKPWTGKRVVLWDYSRKVLNGQDIENVAQAVGDCVSWGCRNAVDYLACTEIALKGDVEDYHGSFASYFYGVSRVLIGGDRGSYEDGSLGSWAAQGVIKYGVLRSDFENCPAYSGRVAKEWGANGPPQSFVDEGSKHLIGATAPVKGYTDVRDALANGYACTVACGIGFEGNNMQGREDGGKLWEKPSGSWAHQQSFIGVDDDSRRPGVFVMNSWGTRCWSNQPDNAPKGGYWVDAETVDAMCREGDSFAFSNFAGFPAQPILWDLI